MDSSTPRTPRKPLATSSGLAALLLAAACGPAGPTPGPGAPEGPAGLAPETVGRVPVVLIIFDALNAEHIGHLGYERDTTPNLDAFAAEGVSFRGAFAPAPYTVAGVASLVTGQLPDRHGIVTKVNKMRGDEWTLAELLSRAGYATQAVIANPNGGERFGALQGFDEHIPLYTVSEERPVNFTDPSTGVGLHFPHAEEFAPLLASFIDGVEPGRPFFFHGHVLEPHSPYVAPEPWRTKFLDPAYDGPFAAGDDKTLIQSNRGLVEVRPEDAAAVRALYDGNIAYADHAFGLMMDELKARGLYESSLILVTSDHGEAMYQHGVWGHNDTLYDEMLQVPLMVRFPGSAEDGGARGIVREELASTMDILPSICQWLDLAPPEVLDGRSLGDLLSGGEAASFGERSLALRDHSSPPALALRDPVSKVIVPSARHPETGVRVMDRVEFYDLLEDPEELSDLGASDDPRVPQAKAEVQGVIELLVTYQRETERTSFTAEEQAMLGALGYTDDAPGLDVDEDGSGELEGGEQ